MAEVPQTVAFVASLFLLGCATSPPAAQSPPPTQPAREARPATVPRPPDPGEDRVVALVGEREIRESDIGEFVIRYFRDRANEALTQLIDSVLIEREAQAAGIEVSESLVFAEVDREISRRKRSLAERLGPSVSYEDYLRERYGVTLAEHRRDVALLVRTRLLRDRVIRFARLKEERLRVRDAAFGTREAAQAAAKAVRSGADLHRLSTQEGLFPSVVPPPLTRDDFDVPAMADAAFGLAPGKVSKPVPVRGPKGTVWHVLKCLERVPAREGPWESLRNEIEAGIRERPVEQWEYARWAQKMRDRHRARVLR